MKTFDSILSQKNVVVRRTTRPQFLVVLTHLLVVEPEDTWILLPCVSARGAVCTGRDWTRLGLCKRPPETDTASVSEIQVFYCAHAGCKGSQNRAPDILFMCSPLYKGIIVIYVRKSLHTLGAQVMKSVHPAAKVCTPGAGCILNFEHCACKDFPSSLYCIHVARWGTIVCRVSISGFTVPHILVP